MSRHYKDWLKAYLSYAEKISETPVEMLYWAGVSAIAGALQRRVFIDQRRFQLYPNFFIVFVADPGIIQKSTTINTAIKLLTKVPNIVVAPDATTWEGFIKFMEDNHQSDNAFDANNFGQDQHKSSAITISASELSVFLDPTNKPMLSALTKLWDCEDVFVKLTKFSGTEHIEKPCLNLIGGTTPAWMRESFDRWSREGGFVSRTIFIYGQEKRQLLAFPGRNLNQQQQTELTTKLIADLEEISKLKGEYVLEPRVFDLGEEWYKEHYRKVSSAGYVDSSGFKDRKQAHILKLAMVIAASRGERLSITDEIWAEAVVRVDEAELSFPKAFSSIDERQELRPYYDLRNTVKTEGEIELSRLYSRYTRRYLLREMQQAVDALIQSGTVLKVAKEGGRIFLKWKGEEDGN